MFRSPDREITPSPCRTDPLTVPGTRFLVWSGAPAAFSCSFHFLFHFLMGELVGPSFVPSFQFSSQSPVTPTLCAAALGQLTAWVQVLLAAAVATHMEVIPVATAFLGMTARSLSLLEQQLSHCRSLSPPQTSSRCLFPSYSSLSFTPSRSSCLRLSLAIVSPSHPPPSASAEPTD